MSIFDQNKIRERRRQTWKCHFLQRIRGMATLLLKPEIIGGLKFHTQSKVTTFVA